MSEFNKSFRIRTNINQDKSVNVQINQDYDIYEILSLKISTENLYRMHSSKYGCIVGRVLANGGVGVPNAKVSVFIPMYQEDYDDPIISSLYPYSNTYDKNSDDIRFNLLPNNQIDDCHRAVGTFPSKRLVLDDDNIIEIYDTYYKYSTVTNGSGDYMIFGVPTGNTTIHSDIDLSDIGILSQKPRDLLYKGYNITMFDTPNQFKSDTNLDNLTQIISQDTTVYVYPFWGDESEGEIKITRNDIDVNYKFEPTCVFIGSIISDEKSQGISKRCIPSDRMGKMDRLTTGQGTIEMIRKRQDGSVEEFPISGNQLIDGNGTWCYQIPMNLDYMATDEYGNLVPTDDIERGIPTRAKVRFRISLADYESDYVSPHLVKMLVPNNTSLDEKNVDYSFGSDTKDKSFKDLFWNNVYTVKSYIPRIQKGERLRSKKFTGIKAVNVNGKNNPLPYNNLRVNLTFLFSFQCMIFKILIRVLYILNKIINFMTRLASGSKGNRLMYVTLYGNMCQSLENVKIDNEEKSIYVAPGAFDTAKNGNNETYKYTWSNTREYIIGHQVSIGPKKGGNKDDYENFDNKGEKDEKSVEDTNKPSDNSSDEYPFFLTTYEYFVKCVELQFAMEYEVIQFDFYNDWVNGVIYIPRWFADIKKRKRYLNDDSKFDDEKVIACNETFQYNRKLVQQCALEYDENGKVISNDGCLQKKDLEKSENDKQLKCHKAQGIKVKDGVCKQSGLIYTYKTYQQQKVYYLKPNDESAKVRLFATDLILLGSLTDCNIYGIPKIRDLNSSTYRMPPPTAQIVSDTDDMSLVLERPNRKENPYVVRITGEIAEKTDEEYPMIEVAGIDWGYNPFKSEDTVKDTEWSKHGGHFLEIGCTNSAVNSRSCVNLQRICEIGSDISQSHYYKDSDVYSSVTGYISKRELNDSSIRTIIAMLNSCSLKTINNTNTGYPKYEFKSYLPFNFDSAFPDKDELDKIESLDYVRYRFGDKGFNYYINNGDRHSMPVYENSYYFYFGLNDGNTAIDRLYRDYFSECPKLIVETGYIPINCVEKTSGITYVGAKVNEIKTPEFPSDEFTNYEDFTLTIGNNTNNLINVKVGGYNPEPIKGNESKFFPISGDVKPIKITYENDKYNGSIYAQLEYEKKYAINVSYNDLDDVIIGRVVKCNNNNIYEGYVNIVFEFEWVNNKIKKIYQYSNEGDSSIDTYGYEILTGSCFNIDTIEKIDKFTIQNITLKKKNELFDIINEQYPNDANITDFTLNMYTIPCSNEEPKLIDIINPEKNNKIGTIYYTNEEEEKIRIEPDDENYPSKIERYIDHIDGDEYSGYEYSGYVNIMFVFEWVENGTTYYRYDYSNKHVLTITNDKEDYIKLNEDCYSSDEIVHVGYNTIYLKSRNELFDIINNENINEFKLTIYAMEYDKIENKLSDFIVDENKINTFIITK